MKHETLEKIKNLLEREGYDDTGWDGYSQETISKNFVLHDGEEREAVHVSISTGLTQEELKEWIGSE